MAHLLHLFGNIDYFSVRVFSELEQPYDGPWQSLSSFGWHGGGGGGGLITKAAL
jgi:hypothetical protein